jgi:hypothetical protein
MAGASCTFFCLMAAMICCTVLLTSCSSQQAATVVNHVFATQTTDQHQASVDAVCFKQW